MEITDILSSTTFDFSRSVKLTEPDHRIAFELALAYVLRNVGQVVANVSSVIILRKTKKTKGRYSELVAEFGATSAMDVSLSKEISNVIYQSSDQDFVLELIGETYCRVLVCADPIYCRVIFDENDKGPGSN